MMSQSAIDRVLGGVLFAIAVAWTWGVVDTIAPASGPAMSGPRFFPLVLGILLGVLALAVVLSTFSGRAAAKIPDAADQVFVHEREPLSKEVRIVVSVFVLMVAYTFFMDKVGFLIATPIAVVVALNGILRIKSWKASILLALGMTVGCHLIFDVLMNAYLPRGTWLHFF
ncbi:tripartite tricarboxylate transporter TctB family protein [Varunaivibrio sulfuroxidans]|uniref:Tripartite tricarboxylate transporter TctB family protein n=1 Tax=Varunaivibrio sulfuroxidans TaxID=1773489 RepID=A0A4R3JBT0_9PROT|nr:tripartite tricarboxylate transporter TctB family protein [Varunaivibrio sulfuroxidans]TCS63097.1 tripartite tricarboxylate transporter TctB family protein [Varunaivibrio sulfuroxidans]WES31831.1 tripartite tricarboxylate transporter TctB family protein [Varunaivibrio sulfuroxidans]